MSIFDTAETNSVLLNSLNSANTPQKRISEIFDVSITPGSAPMVILFKKKKLLKF